MAKILITGASGMIGRPLTQRLLDAGHEVVHLSRTPSTSSKVPAFKWNPADGTIDDHALKGVNIIVHLAGAGLADQSWTDARKQEILDSRINSASLLHEACKRNGVRLDNFISASAIGWYPLIISDIAFDEGSPEGQGFVAEVCKSWEDSADQFADVSDRVCKLRIGLVLGKNNGALREIEWPVRMYIGAGLGEGTQSMSWIHLDDVSRMFVHVIEKKLDGVYNSVGPEPTPNIEFMQTMADVMGRPIMLPNIPEFIIKLIYGPKSEVILKGAPISSKKIEATGFEFEYPTLTSALMNIYYG